MEFWYLCIWWCYWVITVFLSPQICIISSEISLYVVVNITLLPRQLQSNLTTRIQQNSCHDVWPHVRMYVSQNNLQMQSMLQVLKRERGMDRRSDLKNGKRGRLLRCIFQIFTLPAMSTQCTIPPFQIAVYAPVLRCTSGAERTTLSYGAAWRPWWSGPARDTSAYGWMRTSIRSDW